MFLRVTASYDFCLSILHFPSGDGVSPSWQEVPEDALWSRPQTGPVESLVGLISVPLAECLGKQHD